MNRALLFAAVIAFASFTSTARADDAPAPPAATPAAAAPPTAAPTTEPPAGTASHRTAWPWIILGTGVALVVTAAAFEVRAVADDDSRGKYETQFSVLQTGDPNRQKLVDAAQSKDDAAKSSRTIALVVGTVGFLAIAGSVVLWFYEGGSSSPDTPPKAAKAKSLRPSFTPSFSPSYAGASFGASF